MNNTIFLEFRCPRPLSSRSLGRQILETIKDYTPGLIPEAYGNYEPIKKPYQPADIDTILASWHDDFLWRRRHPRTLGSVWIQRSENPRHDYMGMNIAHGYHSVSATELILLYDKWCILSGPDIAYIHLLTADDVPRGVASKAVLHLDRVGKKFTIVWPTPLLRQYLPDFYWRMTFGPPYIDLFTRERLLSAPAHEVRELDSGHITIQLTESYLDLETDYPRVAAIRDRVIEHLGPEAFFAEGRTEYRTPKFVFPR